MVNGLMRKTKIICTLGPSSSDEATLRRMMEAGMDVARFNFSHGTHEEHLEKFRIVDRLREELGLHIGTMLDTKGRRSGWVCLKTVQSCCSPVRTLS